MPTRVNKITNPKLENNLDGWFSIRATGLTRVSVNNFGDNVNYALEATGAGDGNFGPGLYPDWVPVQPGNKITISMRAECTGTPLIQMVAGFYDSSNNLVSRANGRSRYATGTGTDDVYAFGTVPSGASYVYAYFFVREPNYSDLFRVSRALVEVDQGEGYPEYFDGDFPECSWQAAPNASRSITHPAVYPKDTRRYVYFERGPLQESIVLSDANGMSNELLQSEGQFPDFYNSPAHGSYHASFFFPGQDARSYFTIPARTKDFEFRGYINTEIYGSNADRIISVKTVNRYESAVDTMDNGAIRCSVKDASGAYHEIGRTGPIPAGVYSRIILDVRDGIYYTIRVWTTAIDGEQAPDSEWSAVFSSDLEYIRVGDIFNDGSNVFWDTWCQSDITPIGPYPWDQTPQALERSAWVGAVTDTTADVKAYGDIQMTLGMGEDIALNPNRNFQNLDHWHADANSSLFLATSYFYTGNYSAGYFTNGTAVSAVMYSDPVSISGSTSYQFRHFIKIPGGYKYCVSQILWYNGTTYITESRLTDLVSDGIWTERIVTAFSPPTANQAVLRFYMFDTPSITAYIDNASLREVTSYVGIGTEPDPDSKMVDFNIAGLNPNSRYFWLVYNSVEEVILIQSGEFITHPAPNAPQSFRFGASSCAGLDPLEQGHGDVYLHHRISNYDGHEIIRQHGMLNDWLFFAHLGDMVYFNPGQSNPYSLSFYRSQWNEVLQQSNQAGLYSDIPMLYMWDDHDYGPNDSNRTAPGRLNAQQAYREKVPHYPLPATVEADGNHPIYQSIEIGRILFILSDLRSSADPENAPDDSNKTMLGQQQKDWMRSVLQNSQAKAFVWFTTSPFNAAAGAWSVYQTEAAEMAQMFRDTGWKGRMIAVGGDFHYMAIEDGSTTTAVDGIPIAIASGIDSSNNDPGTHYSHGGISPPERGVYLDMEVTDENGQLSITAHGWYRNTHWKSVQLLSINTNAPPIADAGPDQTVDQNDIVQLRGIGSSDPEGSNLDFSWSVTDDGGTGLTNADITNRTTATPFFAAPDVSSFIAVNLVLTLTVTDTGGLSDTDAVTITVTPDNVIAPDFVGPSDDVFSPTLQPGQVQIALEFTPSSASVFSPVLHPSYTVPAEYIPSESQVFEPAFGETIFPLLRDQQQKYSNHRISSRRVGLSVLLPMCVWKMFFCTSILHTRKGLSAVLLKQRTHG